MAETLENLLRLDHQHIWHPCTQMKDLETTPPLIVKHARGSYLELADGRKVIDAISSWWCKTLGHNHPRLKQALINQLNLYEHAIFANTTNEVIVSLSQKLCALTETLKKVAYASDGSSAVEMALKLSLHSRQMTREKRRKQFISLQNSYHGETVGALSVSDMGLYSKPYDAILFKTQMISNLPYVTSQKDALWTDCSEAWEEIETKLAPYAETATAVIVEPIVQGAAGMQIYSADFLRRLRQWTKAHGVHLIADEIMTGFCRTGKLFAYQHAGIEPDISCLGKGLTGGMLPMSAVMMTDAIYQLFYDDYEKQKSFLHSHTHSGNALAASVALELLHSIAAEDLINRAVAMGEVMHQAFVSIAEKTQRLTNIRHIGGIVAADLIGDPKARNGFAVYREAIKLGALLRPLGNTI